MKKRTYKKKEESLHAAICSLLKYKYPNLIFHSDPSGVKLTMGQSVALKKTRSLNKIPDLFIAEPVKKYSGLYLEIKKSRDEIYTKSGELRKDKHLQEQLQCLNLLTLKGYCALFVGGIDDAVDTIHSYISGDHFYLEIRTDFQLKN